MAFKDLQEFFDPTLRLPIGGKTYVVESVDAKTGIWCQRLFTTGAQAASGLAVTEADVAQLELDDEQERELYEKVLGAAYDEMIVDAVPWEFLKHAGITAFMWVAVSRDAAEEFWASGESVGKPGRPVPQDHKAPARKRASRKTPTSTVTASNGGSTPRTLSSPATVSPTSSGVTGP